MNNVLDWLESSADLYPNKPAFVDENGQISFEALQTSARSVGSFLCSVSTPRMPVAFFLEKSTVAISGMLGAVYAGCLYSVLDVRQPKDRLDHILATLKPSVIMTDRKWLHQAKELFSGTGIEVATVEDAMGFEANKHELLNRRAGSSDLDPLYVNFTSGSTGAPKGVAVGHRSVIDFIPSFTEIFEISESDRIANQAPFDFDVSVKDIYSGISTGATTYLIPREYFSTPVQLMDFLCEHEVTVCTWAVSAMCFVSIMGGFEYRVPQTIRKVIFSGEVMPPKQLSKWQQFLPEATFVNVYGPTEITCNCTYYIVDREFSKDETIPMGKPFPNERVFLLDGDNKLVTEEGVEGEVCVCGSTLALGYYNDSAKTAASFVQNPLNKQLPELMYRTGDLARYDASGDLVYCSRKDHQIKHLGQRIELGEIDAASQGIAEVARACTIYDSKKKRILLFYVGGIEKDAVVDQLRVKLPQYMVPNKTFQITDMPLTKNGKIDRAALLELAGTRKRSKRS